MQLLKKSVFYKFSFCFLLHTAQNMRELMGFSVHLVPYVLLVQAGDKLLLFHINCRCLFRGCFQLFGYEGKCSYFKLILKKNTFNNLFFSVISDVLRNILLLSRGQKGMNLGCAAPPWELELSSVF